MSISLKHIVPVGLLVAICTLSPLFAEAQGVHLSVASPSKSPSPRADATLTLRLQGKTIREVANSFGESVSNEDKILSDETTTIGKDVSLEKSNESGKNGSALTASVSISVVNNGQTEVDTTNGGIEAYLLLTSDIRGYVENAGYYFESNDSIHTRSLDDLLLTQGWSRFNVADLLSSGIDVKSQDEPHYYMERGLFLSGYVKTFLGKPVISAPVTIIGSNGIARQEVTDNNGRFIEEDLWFDEGTRFIVQAIDRNGKSNIQIRLDEPSFKIISPSIPLGLFTVNDDHNFYIKHSKDYVFADNGERLLTFGGVKVGATSVAGQKDQFFIDFYDEDATNMFLMGFTDAATFGRSPEPSNPRFYTELEWSIRHHHKFYAFGIEYFDGENIESIPFMSDEMKARWRTILDSERVMNGEEAKYVTYTDPKTGTQLLGITFSLFDGTSIYSNLSATPVFNEVAETTHTEVSWNTQTIVPFAPQSVGAEFYKPSYDVPTELLKEPQDEKITRYWNPVVQLSSGETFSVTFPTADGAGNHSYTLTVEGLTSDGAPIHKTYRYEL